MSAGKMFGQIFHEPAGQAWHQTGSVRNLELGQGAGDNFSALREKDTIGIFNIHKQAILADGSF